MPVSNFYVSMTSYTLLFFALLFLFGLGYVFYIVHKRTQLRS
jgi:hypothetical protein